MSLKKIVEDTDTRAGRIFDLTIQSLIVFSLVSFSIDTIPDLNVTVRIWLYWLEVVTVSLFTIEYILRILVANKRLRFIFSLYGLVDLAAILPFYIFTGVDLRTIRILRFFRIFRAFKFLRYTKAINRFKAVFREIKEELVLCVIAMGVMLYLSSVGIYYFESQGQPDKFGSIFQCLWWAIVTLTTVGYGEVYPITVGGRIFTAIILLIGIGVVAVPTGLLASALTQTVEAENESDSEEPSLASG